MNNLVYTDEMFRAVCTEWFRYISEQPCNHTGGILLEDFTEIYNRADRHFDPKPPRKPLKEDHTEEYLEKLGYYDEQKKDIPTADELKDSGDYEKVAEVSSSTMEAPKDDDNMQQASDIKDIADHIAVASHASKICKKCGKVFAPETPKQYICTECKKENQKEAKRKYARTHSERNKKAKSTDENAERYADSVASEVDRIESVARDILALGDE